MRAKVALKLARQPQAQRHVSAQLWQHVDGHNTRCLRTTQLQRGSHLVVTDEARVNDPRQVRLCQPSTGMSMLVCGGFERVVDGVDQERATFLVHPCTDFARATASTAAQQTKLSTTRERRLNCNSKATFGFECKEKPQKEGGQETVAAGLALSLRPSSSKPCSRALPTPAQPMSFTLRSQPSCTRHGSSRSVDPLC